MGMTTLGGRDVSNTNTTVAEWLGTVLIRRERKFKVGSSPTGGTKFLRRVP